MVPSSSVRQSRPPGLVLGLVLSCLLATTSLSWAAESSVFKPTKLTLSHQTMPVLEDQKIDGGILVPGATRSLVFSMKNETKLPLPLPPDPITIEGEEMANITALPAELAPGERRFFAIQATGSGSGALIRTVTVEGGGETHRFRIMLTVLTEGFAEAKVRETYGRFQRFAAADHRDIEVSLAGFETIYQPDLATTRYLSLFDFVQTDIITTKVLSRGIDSEGIVSYSPSWQTREQAAIADDARRAQWVDNWTMEQLLADAEARDFPIPELLAATTYTAEVKLADQIRSYRAAFVWTVDKRGVFIHDQVLQDIGRVWTERRLPVSRATVRNGDHPSFLRWQKGRSAAKGLPPGARQCHEHNERLVNADVGRLERREEHDDAPWSRHLSIYSVSGECEATRDCVNRCETVPKTMLCDDQGDLDDDQHFLIVHRPYEIEGAPQTEEAQFDAVTCRDRYGCAVGRCYLGFCINSVTFVAPLVLGGGLEIEVDPPSRPFWNLSVPVVHTCPAPVECDPDPSDNNGVPSAPGGFCNGLQVGRHSIAVDANLRGPSQLDTPFTGFVEVAFVPEPGHTASLPALRISRSGQNIPFAGQVPDGTQYRLGILSRSANTICNVNPTTVQTISGSDHRGIQTVTCTQHVVPQGCPLNPTDCIAPPNGCEVVFAGWVGQVIIATGNSGSGTIMLDGNVVDVDWANTFNRIIDVVLGGLRCDSGTAVNPNKSDSTIWGPVLYSRNVHDEPVSGEVVLWGVARDDAHGVSDVEVYLDGQPAPLSRFAFNLWNDRTCSEHATGGTCDATSTYYGVLDTTTLSPGRHSVVINATNTAGASSVITTEILVAPPTQPEVSLVASYAPEAGGQRTTYSSHSADPQPALRFRYDESLGRFHQRVGGACATGSDNPTYLKVRLGGDPSFRIDSCEIRGSWDSQWYTCGQGLVDAINERDYIVLTTDSHTYAPCDFDHPIAPHLGSGQPAWFKVRLRDNGLVYERRIDMVKIP